MSLWTLSKFETRMKIALHDEFDEAGADELFAQYVAARQVLLEDVFEEIRGTEPYLSDHGPRHIRNVLDNVDELLPPNENHFSAIELYLLGLSVLFHDVGNLEGRKNHNQKISKYYDHVRGGHSARFAGEKHLVVSAAQAHTGKAKDGSHDTINDVPDVLHLVGRPIRLRGISAVVRFADELAEGPQRTSHFLRAAGGYPKDSETFHDYAATTSIAIDRGNRRIALTYNLVFETYGARDAERLDRLRKLLEFIYHRIAKLDGERKYARFYCPELLLPFGETSVAFNVQAGGEFQDLGLREIQLSDKVVPDERMRALPEIDDCFCSATVTERLRAILAEEAKSGGSDNGGEGQHTDAPAAPLPPSAPSPPETPSPAVAPSPGSGTPPESKGGE